MRLVFAATVAAGLGTVLAAQQQQQPPKLRSGVELVSLNVSVTSNDGKYVTDLEQMEFEVFEDGRSSPTTLPRSNGPSAAPTPTDRPPSTTRSTSRSRS
jgi:hypothetical protein